MMKSFDTAGTTEDIDFAGDAHARVENPFHQKRTEEKLIYNH